MAFISVPNTLVDGTSCDPTKINANFTALTDGLSDGTKDVIVQNVTCSNVTATGKVTADNASVANTLTVSGLIEGSRTILNWSGYIIGNATGYLQPEYNISPTSSYYAQIPMTRAGSILSIGTSRYVSACANAQTITPQIVKVATSGVVAAASTLTISAAVTGFRTSFVSSFARNTYQFSAGDCLCAHVVASGTAGSGAMDGRLTVMAEVIFDT